jgi:hypothetical protein
VDFRHLGAILEEVKFTMSTDVIYNLSDKKFGFRTSTMFHSLLVYHKMNALKTIQ